MILLSSGETHLLADGVRMIPLKRWPSLRSFISLMRASLRPVIDTLNTNKLYVLIKRNAGNEKRTKLVQRCLNMLRWTLLRNTRLQIQLWCITLYTMHVKTPITFTSTFFWITMAQIPHRNREWALYDSFITLFAIWRRWCSRRNLGKGVENAWCSTILVERSTIKPDAGSAAFAAFLWSAGPSRSSATPSCSWWHPGYCFCGWILCKLSYKLGYVWV